MMWPLMARAQFARDAVMARALAAHAERGVVLLAGNGHVRRDIGVPRWLASPAPRLVGRLSRGRRHVLTDRGLRRRRADEGGRAGRSVRCVQGPRAAMRPAGAPRAIAGILQPRPGARESDGPTTTPLTRRGKPAAKRRALQAAGRERQGLCDLHARSRWLILTWNAGASDSRGTRRRDHRPAIFRFYPAEALARGCPRTSWKWPPRSARSRTRAGGSATDGSLFWANVVSLRLQCEAQPLDSPRSHAT